MPRIKRIQVENFRSLLSVDVGDLGEYVPLVGLNSTGKSNVLRALNLFFTGYLDEDGTLVDLTRDFSNLAAKGKKKVIRITVTLDLSDGYRARDSLEQFLAAKGVTNQLVVRREWSYIAGVLQLTSSFGPHHDALQEPNPAEVLQLEAILRSFGFRYVPNHSRPSDLIASVTGNLSEALVSRWKKTKAYREGKVEETMAALQHVADELVSGLSTNVAKPGTRVSRVRASTPVGLAAFAIQVGLSVTTDGGEIQDPELQGSGTQSFMLLHVLDLLAKTQRELGFGWWPYSIWGIEEPESFLHAGLRARYADDLRHYAADPHRQVFITTHQDEFVRVSDFTYVVRAGSIGTTVEQAPTRNALTEMSRQRVTTYPHPLFLFPDHPIVIVEGVSDFDYLRHGLVESGLRPPWKLLSLQEMGLDKGGDDLKAWLKQNAAVLAARPEGSPVIVLRDWEERAKASWDTALSPHPYSTCFVCPSRLANPELDESFVGIERYLETAFVAAHAGTRLKRAATGVGPYSILRPDLSTLKPLLHREFLAAPAAGGFLQGLCAWISAELADTLPATVAI